MKGCEQAKTGKEEATHLENISKLRSDVPFSGYQFMFAEVEVTDCGHCINGNTVPNGKFKHVIGRVPACRHIPGHHTRGKAMRGKCLVPHWQEDGRRILECERNFP